MARRKMLCEQYQQGESPFGNSLDAGGYRAAVKVDALPRALNRDDHIVRRGSAPRLG